VNYLVDVNILVAWGWSDHVEHARVASWIAALPTDELLLTSAIPQLGFVRVSVQRSGGLVTVSEAAETLRGMLALLGERHRFLPDAIDALHWPDWCRSPAQTTNAHLLDLALANSATLATLDTAIPGAMVLPPLTPVRNGFSQ